VQAAFEVAEQNGDGFNAFFVGEILEALFLDFVHRHAILALFFGFQIQLLQLVVRKGQEIAKFVRHEAPQIGIRLTLRDEHWRKKACQTRNSVSRARSKRQSKDLME
jgi:hypothetical protein